MSNLRIALLRGVNTGGRKVVMSELKAGLEAMGLKDARTLQAAGSVVFEDPKGRSDGALEAFLETESVARLGLKTEYYVRRPAEWRRLIEANPFPDQARDAPSMMTLLLFRETPPASAWEVLRAANPGRELMAGGERAGYIFYPDGIGASTIFSKNLVDRCLGKLNTGRNWNTVLKLGEMAGA